MNRRMVADVAAGLREMREIRSRKPVCEECDVVLEPEEVYVCDYCRGKIEQEYRQYLADRELEVPQWAPDAVQPIIVGPEEIPF